MELEVLHVCIVPVTSGVLPSNRALDNETSMLIECELPLPLPNIYLVST